MYKFGRKAEAESDENGNKIITQRFLSELCEETGLYTTASLNEKLFISHRGLSKIDGLEKFTGVKALYLDSNMFRKMENLSHFKLLRCLYLQNNLIEKIEGVEELENLSVLSLCGNKIQKIEGLS